MVSQVVRGLTAILATGLMENNRSNRFLDSSGFSLLEILVVLVIISIIVSFASMSFDTGPEKLENEGQRVTALLKLASEEAIMNSREYRAVFTENSYSFAKLVDGEWREFNDSGVFRPRELSGEFSFEITIGNEPIELARSEDDEPDSRAAILLLSSGEVTPFELVVKNNIGKEITISNHTGQIEEVVDLQ